jgi:membrane-associated protease RseP (regulator of RpoE activity)
VAPLPKNFTGFELGESLLFRGVAWLIWGNVGDGYSLNLHPVGLAAWFGLLATTFNLFPIGQLDGGHISYAVFGRRSTYVTYGAVLIAIILVFISMSWLLWTILMVSMLFAFGPHHPPTADESVPLDRTRIALAVVALLVFILSFMPAPMELVNFLPKK